MKVMEYSAIGGRANNLDRSFSIEKQGAYILVVLDSLGDSPMAFADELKECLIRKIEGLDLTNFKGKGLELEKLIQNASVECRCEGKACIALAIISPETLLILHAGDCRVYLPDRKIRTNDHSVAHERTDIYRSHAYLAAHPLKNHVTRTISKDQQSYEVSEFLPLKEGERLLVCSDGWWRNSQIETIWNISEESLLLSVEKAVESDIDDDNVTVMLYRQ